MSAAGRAATVAAGLLADRFVGDPPDRWHPVAWFGQAMSSVEELLWADRRYRGVVHAAVGVALGAGVGRSADRLARRTGPIPTATLVAAVAAGHQLQATALEVGRALAAGENGEARQRLRTLVGRDTERLDPSEMAAAAIESTAENMVDAVFATAVWTFAAGAAGAGAHRAVNTMDAMVGHRNSRYERYGWASARLDDGANFVPARLFALTLALTHPARADEVRRVVTRHAPAHPSPNAGVAEAAMAAVLGRTLGGPLSYDGRTEDRPLMGDGPRPGPADVRRAVTAARRAETALIVAAAGTAVTLRRTRRKW